jgi:catechol 2,3-dioxygenase-like lactoylglutathione lyase family enzyme
LSGHVGHEVGDAKARLVLGKVGGQLVELIEYEVEEDSGLGDPGIAAFTLRIADATEAYEACQERGLNPESEPVEIEGSRQFFISDPDGILIELTQPPRS